MQKSKVALAVEPLRKDTLEQAKIRTRERIASALEKLAAHDWNPYNFPGASMHPQFGIARKAPREAFFASRMKWRGSLGTFKILIDFDIKQVLFIYKELGIKLIPTLPILVLFTLFFL